METTVRRGREHEHSSRAGREGGVVSPPRSPAALAAHRARCLALADRHGELSRYHRREAYRYEPSAFQHALAFIEAHLTDRLTLEQVTRHAGLSPGPFSGQLKKTTGYRFSRYVATRRIERAKDLLLDFNKKVSTVADEAGFQSWPDFYFWFKRLTRLTPTEYRRRAARRKWPRQKKPGQNGAGRNGSGKKKRARNSGASCRSGKPR